jgi:uncharacterized protein YndB with AHSA1/START domain
MVKASLVVALLFATPAFADVTASAPGGFVVELSTTIDAPRSDVYDAALDVGRWWSGDHTVSGDAGRMSIEPRAQGCFCEDLGDGNAIVHLVVTFINRDVLLRLTGGLGPLGLMGLNGNMTWEFFDDDAGTRVNWTYAVGGFHEGGLDAMAEPVDGVLREALARLEAYVETGDAGNAVSSTE